jgi:hypothetical protein
MWQHLAQWSLSEFIKYVATQYGTQFNHFSVILIGQFGIIFFNFLNSKKKNYSFISPLKEQGMDAYLSSPAASPRGKIRLFGRCQFCNMTNLHLEF